MSIRHVVLIAAIGILFNGVVIQSLTSTTTQYQSSTSKTGETTASASSVKTTKTTKAPIKSTPSVKTTQSIKSTPVYPTKAILDATSAVPEVVDPYVGGKPGNPGARIHLSNKTIDALHVFSANVISRGIGTMAVGDFSVPVGSSVLTIKSPRVSESKFSNYEYELLPPNKMRSTLYNGKIVADGMWQYGSQGSVMAGGRYQTTIVNGELEIISQFGRSNDGKPTISMAGCNANISQFKVDIQGSSAMSVLQNCDNPVCQKVREFYEAKLCQAAGVFVEDVVGREMSKYPVRSELQQQYQMDYGLKYNEPIVTQYDIRAGLEGKVLSRGYGNYPFNPYELSWTDKARMLSLELGDYAFNTLLQQAHGQNYRFSVDELAPKTTAVRDALKMNCSSPSSSSANTRKASSRKLLRAESGQYGKNCLGSLFENITGFGQYASNDTGDLIFISRQKAPWVYVQNGQNGYFDGNNGALEIYGGADQYGKRQLLARVDVRVIRGGFSTKLVQSNITGLVKLNTLQLAPAQPQSRSMTEDWFEKLAEFALPLLTDTFNGFLNTNAQFPVPLPDGYKCESPELLVHPRSVQVNCDIAVSKKTHCVCKVGFCMCQS